MYWNVTVLTKMGSIRHQTLKGRRQEVLEQIRASGLDLISLQADWGNYIQNVFKRTTLSAADLSVFFKDFSRCLKSGLSAQEAIFSLNEHTSNPSLKEILKKVNLSIIHGSSIKSAFENTRAYPLIVLGAVDAAEKSGSLAEVCGILSEYFKFMGHHKIKLLKSLVYPACVFMALTVASIVISLRLAPQLSSILPAGMNDQWSAQCIIGYAHFMQAHGWIALAILPVSMILLIKAWEHKKDRMMQCVLGLPLVGDLIKQMEFAALFLNLYVYQKSGMNIMAAISHIYANQPNVVTLRLEGIKHKVSQGYSLGDALKADAFFPSFISMNVKKGESTGHLYQYFYEIHQYYNQKSQDSMETLIALINPALLTIAVSYLGMIIYCFILPLYSSMSGTQGLARY